MSAPEVPVLGYESLLHVLARAHEQAALGKGAERHACTRPFTEQPMQSISRLLGNETGLLYQAMKKIQESQRMDQDAAVKELLGAINYIAGAIIFKEAKPYPAEDAPVRPAEKPLKGVAPFWVCYHGHPDDPGLRVPLGEPCPRCFAFTN